jgi:AraC-like DNA-binding protein
MIFQYTLSGCGYIKLDGVVYPLPKGSGFLVKVPSFHEYYYSSDSEEPWEFIWLNVKGEDAAVLWDRLIDKVGHIFELPMDSPVIEGFWEVYDHIRCHQSPEQIEISTRMYGWIIRFLQTGMTRYASTQTRSVIGQAKFYMRQNLHQALSLDELTAYVGVSKQYLCRIFDKHGEEPPLEYWRKRRVEAAALLLRTTDVSISNIAVQYGFESLDYFGKTFRRYLGVSPTEYRKQELRFPFDRVFL